MYHSSLSISPRGSHTQVSSLDILHEAEGKSSYEGDQARARCEAHRKERAGAGRVRGSTRWRRSGRRRVGASDGGIRHDVRAIVALGNREIATQRDVRALRSNKNIMSGTNAH